jgi:hypothetical protein
MTAPIASRAASARILVAMGLTRGRHLALVVVSTLAWACTSESNAEPSSVADDTTTTTAPEERADLSGLDAAGIEARRVEPTLGEGERFETDPLVATAAVAFGGALLSAALTDDGSQHLARSTDLGASWQPVDLPGAPDRLRSHQVDVVGGRVVAAASTSSRWSGADGSIWTTEDGTTWRGGPVPAAPPGASLAGRVTELPDGRLAVPTWGPDQAQPATMALVTSDGATWEAIDCPPGWARDGACAPPPAVAGLWLRPTEVSLDAGATWQPIVVTPPSAGAAEGRPDEVLTAVARPGGGWVGLGYHSEAGTRKLWSVVRSDDGVAWETVLGDPCGAAGVDAVESTYDPPVLLGDGWLVTHTCFQGWRPLRSELTLLDAAGANPRTVATTDVPGLWFGPPVVVGEAVVVPERSATGTTTFLQLRP